MQRLISRKNQSFREQIRRNYHQDYKRSKRKQMFESSIAEQNRQLQDQNLMAIYWNILNLNTPQNLRSMDEQNFQNNLQMLKEIISSPNNSVFLTSFEPILCMVIQYFYQSLNQCHNFCIQMVHQLNIQDNELQSVEQICKLVALNKMFTHIKPNDFIPFVGLIYYEIVPHNMVILKKVVDIMKQILTFSLKDSCVVADCLQKLNQLQDQPINQTINRASVILVLMNITYNQDNQVLKIVEESKFIQCLAEGMEVYGFSEQEKQNVAGLYSNFIEYIQSKANTIADMSYQEEQKKKIEIQFVLCLPIYEQLVKMQNEIIISKMMIVSTILFKVISFHDLDCKAFFCQLCQQFVRNIIIRDEYYENSQDLFLVLAEEITIKSDIVWFLDFLRIILKNYTLIYYNEKSSTKKDKQNKSKSKCLRKISQLVVCCQKLLQRGEGLLSVQQSLVVVLIDLWCREQLYPIRANMLSFIVAGLTINKDLAEFIINSYEEQLIVMMNESYEFTNQIEYHILLVQCFFQRLQTMSNERKQNIIKNNHDAFANILTRLQDYSSSQIQQNQNISLRNAFNISNLQKLLDGGQYRDM